MKHQHVSSAGNAPKVVDHYVVALYEPSTGTIRHVHTVTLFEGGNVVDEREAIRRAHDKATKAGHNTATLRFKVSKNSEHGRRPHRIDVTTDQFIPIQLTNRHK